MLYAAMDEFKQSYPDLCANYNLRRCKNPSCTLKHEVPSSGEMRAFSDKHSLGMQW